MRDCVLYMYGRMKISQPICKKEKDKGQTTMASKKHTHKTKGRVTRTPLIVKYISTDVRDKYLVDLL